MSVVSRLIKEISKLHLPDPGEMPGLSGGIKKVLIPVAAVSALSALYLQSTKYTLKVKISRKDIPAGLEDLDEYIRKAEEKHDDIVPGTEKALVWANGKKAMTDYAVIFIHGFSASRQELEPLPRKVAEMLNANIFYTRLAGHGRSQGALEEATANDWLNNAVEAIELGRKIGREVILIGSSTGCPLITWLLSRKEYRDIIHASVLVSPNFYPANKQVKLFLYPLGTRLAKMISGEEREWEPSNEDIAKYWTCKYKWEAVVPMMILVEHVRKTVNLRKIKVPTLFLYTDKDDVIDYQRIIEAYRLFGSEQKRVRNLSQVNHHVMAGDIVSPETTELLFNEIKDFMTDIGNEQINNDKQ